MRISYSLLRKKRHRATIVPARMKANENFNDAGVERLRSVSAIAICGSVCFAKLFLLLVSPLNYKRKPT